MALVKLRKLAQDEAGNVLALSAAAMIVFVALVGSALDLSVAYMARGKLQNACDAAVLAARQSMTGSRYNADVEAEADRFFAFNFPQATANTTDVSFDIEQNPDNRTELLGDASASVPTTLVRIIGINEVPISVNCDASRDLGHNDVMLVLDVTGSMNNAPSNGGGTKIARLRTGAAGLYRALDTDDGSVTRFGIVPYSHTVNVGGLLRSQDIRLNNDYVDGTFTAEWTWTECDVRVFFGRSFFFNCRLQGPSATEPTAGYNADNTRFSRGISSTETFTHTGTRQVHVKDSQWGAGSGAASIAAWQTSGDACIEERRSVGNRPYEIEDSVSRADIDDYFTSDWRLRFGIYDPEAQFGETQSGCPSPAKRLAEYSSEASFTAAINAATARVTGGTYHDLGILWGARLVSRTGLFAGTNVAQGDNVTEINTVPVNTHIVFMTDGRLDVDDANGSNDLYSAHSVERFMGRTQGDGTNLENHKARFSSACARAREMGITVWVIALDVTDTADVSACASTPDNFFTSDGSDLEEVFEAIGRGIGSLRLTR